MKRAHKLISMVKEEEDKRQKVRCKASLRNGNESPVPQGCEKEVAFLSNLIGNELDFCDENENNFSDPTISISTNTTRTPLREVQTLEHQDQQTCQHSNDESIQHNNRQTSITSPSVLEVIDSTQCTDNTTDVSDSLIAATDAELENPSQAPWLEVQNLSVYSVNINLESPASSFTIPTPQSSVVSSPVSTHSRKRKNVKKQGSGKVRTRNILHWQDFKRKALKNKGKPFTNRAGKTIQEKEIKPPCSWRCIRKCREKFDSIERTEIFKSYWDLGSHELQWNFISKYVSSHEPKRLKAEGPNRTQVMTYTLPKKTDGIVANPVVVGRTMFLNTLSISSKIVRTVFKKLQENNHNVNLSDMRGRHNNRPHKIKPSVVDSVRDHILSLAPVESHYCRKYSTKYYLDGQLSYTRLHKLYCEWFKTEKYGTVMATARQYQDIVNENFNIAFYAPKKDQCEKCHAFHNIREPTEEQKSEHEKHLKCKDIARALKEADKKEALECCSVVTACFDMQKILTCPLGNVGVFYYKRKLNLYNFTVYDLAKKQGFCYMWNETTGKKGANEINSGLESFMKSKIEEGAKEFRFWSDNCSGQNRNRIVFAMYQFFVEKYEIKSITHRFLEVGHMQSEGDNVHSVIEGASKNRTLYTPDQWYNVVRWAKVKGESYRVKEMTLNDIYNYRPLLNGKNWIVNDDGEKVHWNKIKEVHVNTNNINTIKYKYELNEDYKTVTTLKTIKTRKTNKNMNIVTCVEKANNEPIKIKNDKYKDLLSLCTANIIPEEFQQFFKSLPHESVASTVTTDIADEEE